MPKALFTGFKINRLGLHTMAGAPKGNKNGSKQNRLWGDILTRVATQNPDKMRKAAETLLEMAAEGDLQAMREIGDRLDGKPRQAIDMGMDDDTLNAMKIIKSSMPYEEAAQIYKDSLKTEVKEVH